MQKYPDLGNSVFPEILEAGNRELRVADSVLDVLVPEILLDGPGVVTIVSELISAGVAQHVRVNGEGEAGFTACSSEDFSHGRRCERTLALRDEHVRRLGVVASKAA